VTLCGRNDHFTSNDSGRAYAKYVSAMQFGNVETMLANTVVKV